MAKDMKEAVEIIHLLLGEFKHEYEGCNSCSQCELHRRVAAFLRKNEPMRKSRYKQKRKS